MDSFVVAVARSRRHTVEKPTVECITLIAGLGVEGDAHAGDTVQHRYAKRRDPSSPNLRQVHLIAAELHDALRADGFDVGPGVMGENVTTRGIELLDLPVGTGLRLGRDALVQLTGLRTPCRHLERISPGLMKATLGPSGRPRLGVMGVVVEGGEVTPGSPIRVTPPAGTPQPLQPV